MKYPKINTLFKRDEKMVIIPSQFTYNEFTFLKDCLWESTEKIDGTNIRIYITRELDNDNIPFWDINIKGRNENSQIPTPLYDKLKSIFIKIDWDKVFPEISPEETICLYGEGYGKGIQKCGKDYIEDGNDFILFDVRINDLWLKRKDCEDIARKCDIKIVPLVGYMTIPQAIEYVKKGFKSNISENKDLDAEGLVLKTPDGLLFRDGNRIITKIKHTDFTKYLAAYGDKTNTENINIKKE